MTIQESMGRIGRRAVLEGLGVSALGLAGAALLGCGSANAPGGDVSAEKSGKVIGATSGGGLPLNAPVVQGKPREGGVFTAGGAATTNVQFDPHTSLGDGSWGIISEKGLNSDPITAAIRPAVFTSWELSDKEGLTLVFKVHPKLFVHNKPPWNGRQFTAEDAAWNLERIGGLYADRLKIPLASFQRASMVANIQKAQAVDPQTVKVTLSKPNSGFFNGLWDTRVMFMPREMDDIGYTDFMKAGGIGPYQVSEWVTDTRTAFVKNPRYAEFRPGEPHFDSFRTLAIPDPVASQSAFFSGQIAILNVPSPDQLAAARRGRPDANLYTFVDSNWDHLRPNYEFAPFKDYRVRHAIHLAIDYKANSDATYGPEGGWAYQAALCPGYPEAWKNDKVRTLPGYNPDTKAQDIAEGQKLLAAAGYPNGRGLDYEIIFGGSTNDNALRFQNYMAVAFPDMKVTQKPLGPGATFANAQAEGRFQMLAYTITAAPDAVIEITSQFKTGGSRNYGRFSSPEADRLVEKSLVELNRDARTQVLEEFQQKYISDWRPIYPLRANAVKTMVQGDIGGFDQLVGIWTGYRILAWQELRKLFYVDK